MPLPDEGSSADLYDTATTAAPPVVAAAYRSLPDEGSSADIYGPDVKPVPLTPYIEPKGDATWGDVVQAGKAGLHEAGATTAGVFSAVAPYVAPDTDAFTRWQEIGERERGAQQQDVGGMTPAGQAAREGSFWSHPLVVGAEGAPAPVAQAAPAIVGGAVAGPPGALAGAALGAGTYGAGSAVSDFTQQVMDAPEATLMQQPDYAAKIQNGVDPHAARLEFAQEHSGKLAAESSAIGAASALPFAVLGGAGGIGGKILGDSLVMRVLGGGLEAGLIGGAQGGVQTAASGQAGADVGIRGPVTGSEVVSGAVSGAESMAPLGVVGGIRGHATPDRTQTGGEATIARETPEQKADAAKPRATTATPADATATGPPPPTPEVKGAGPAEAAAVHAAQAHPAPAPDLTQRVSEPAPVPEPAAEQAPPVAPEPPSELEAVQREPVATLQEQHDALLDTSNPREAMVYNPGDKLIPLADTERYGQTKLTDGRVVQFDKQGENALTPAKVRGYDNTGRLNDLLQMGPTTKDEAIGRVAAGETPASVTERAPDGTERKAAAGTTDTAPAQVAAMEATKTPGSTVSIEHPADVINDRLRGVAQDAQERATLGEALHEAGAGRDPLAGATKLATSERGIELLQDPTGKYFIRKPDGSVRETGVGTARAMFPKEVQAREQAGVISEGKAATPRAAAEFRQQAMPDRVGTAARGQEPPTLPGRILNVREGLASHADPKTQQLARALTDRVGDIPVHYLSHADFVAATGTGARGAYEMRPDGRDRILLNADHMTRDTLPHEAFHAATARGIAASPHLQSLLERLRSEVATQAPDHAVGSGEELLTRLRTDPTLEPALKQARISPALAKDLGVPAWRKKNLWEGALNLMRRAVGLGPRDITAVEAAAHLGERAMNAQSERAVTPRVTPVAPRPTASEAQFRFQEREASDPTSEPRASDLSDGVAPARFAGRIDAATDYVRNRAYGDARLLGSASARTITAGFRQLFDTPRDWVTRAYEKKWGLASAADKLVDRMGVLGADREKIIKLSTKNMDGLSALNAKDPAEFTKLAKLFVSSTIHGADARDDIGVGKNDHIQTSRVDKTGKVVAIDPSRLPKEHWDAIKGNPKDRAVYKELSPEAKKLYNDTMDDLNRMHQGEVRATRDALAERLTRESKSLPRAQRDALQKAIRREELTDDERERYAKDPNIKALHDYDVIAAKSERGAYFPLRQFDGTHVVTGEHTYELPANAHRYSNNPDSHDYHRIVFDNLKDAYAFDPDLPTTHDTRHYMYDTPAKGKNGPDFTPTDERASEGEDGRQYKIYDESIGGHRPITGDEATTAVGKSFGEEHHVLVNPREMQLVNGNVEGERARRMMLALQAEGKMKNVSQVQPRKNQEIWQQGVNSGHVRSLIKRLDKMDLTDVERERMSDAIKHVAAASTPGSRLSGAFLERDRTGNAGIDVIQTLDKYRRMSAAHEAMAGHRNQIDDLLQQMHDYIDENPSHDDAGAIRQMVNDFDTRVNGFPQDALSDINTNKRWNFVRAYTTMMDLVSPAFMLLHQLHLPLTVFPDLAARHGFATALRIMGGVYKDMLGKEVPMALRATGRAFAKAWRYDHRPTDFIEALKNESKLKDDERALIDYLNDHDVLHRTGIDFSQAYPSASLLDRVSAKSRNFASEFIGSADAFNKVNSALMYYRAAKEAGILEREGQEAAFKYAADGITRTQGQYSSFNKMGAFKGQRMASLLQYKQFPVLMVKMIAKALYNSFAPGVDWPTRARALRTFGFMTLSASAMSGVRGGMAYPIRATDDLLHLFGVTDGWNEHMDELQQGLASELGSTGANAIMNGLGGVTGMYLGHRGGISDPLGLNYLMETAKGNDADNSIYKWLAGPPGGALHNLISAVGDAKQGDMYGMTMNLLPRIATDPIKAFQEGTGVSTLGGVGRPGKLISPPVSLPERIEKALGFTNITEMNAREARAAVGQEQAAQHDARSAVLARARSGDMSGAQRAMQDFNRSNPSNRMTTAELLKARTAKPTVLGYSENARNKAALENRARAYGLQ